MTTTDLQVARLRSSVAAFAVVNGVRARDPASPRPDDRGRRAGPGRRARGRRPSASPWPRTGGSCAAPARPPASPASRSASSPAGDRISDPVSVQALELLDIAPPALRPRIAAVTLGPHGLTAQLRGGPALYFGDTTRLHAKWDAARPRSSPTRGSRGALYVDVHTPDRPAAQVADPSRRAVGRRAGTASGPWLGTTPASSPARRRNDPGELLRNDPGELVRHERRRVSLTLDSRLIPGFSPRSGYGRGFWILQRSCEGRRT